MLKKFPGCRKKAPNALYKIIMQLIFKATVLYYLSKYFCNQLLSLQSLLNHANCNTSNKSFRFENKAAIH